MSINVQHEDAWGMHVSSLCSQSTDKEDDTNKLEVSKACAIHHDTSLTERDYIGLSATSTASTSVTQTIFHNLVHLDSSKCSDDRDNKPECEDTELRLGIGPYNGDTSALPTPQHGHLVQSVPHQHLFPQNQILKQAVDGSNAQYWCHEDASGNGSVEFHQSFWPWGPGVAPGRFMIPVPKVSMVPAKRPYLEVMGENKSSICTLATNSNTTSDAVMLERTNHASSSSALPLPTLASSSQGGGGGLYAWGCSTSMPPMVARGAWQHGNSDQVGMVGATLAKNSCLVRALPPPPLFKPSPAPPVSQYDPLPSVMSKSPVAPHLSSSEERASITSDVRKEDASRNKAPMVGWPPVRSFRKNTLQSAAGLGASKGIGASSDPLQHEDASKANESVTDPQIKGSTKDALFVKAKLDGVRICRKVDLTSYSSYDSLMSALQEMFQGFVCSDNSKLDLLHGKNYVLTHEDKDGDWMLVGDVPWRMFVSTVKSLRIMKAVDAVGLGEKVFAKLKAQDMNCKA